MFTALKIHLIKTDMGAVMDSTIQLKIRINPTTQASG
jgi:hypothetical protein